MPRSSWTPADPRKAHQCAFSVLASGPLKSSPSALGRFSPSRQITGLYQASGNTVSLVACVVPCVCFNCLVRRFASVTIATLGMNGWLGLIQQGLSPCKKRQALLGAPTVWLSGSGGTGETRLNGSCLCWQAAPAMKRRSRCPLQPVLGRFLR
jgi:hypothetical protein